MSVIFAIALSLIFQLHNPTMANSFDPQYVQNDVLIVKAKDPMGMWGSEDLHNSFVISEVADSIVSITPSFDIDPIWSDETDFPADQYFTVRLKPGTTLQEAIGEISKFDSVESVQPDFVLTDPDHWTPNDPKLEKQWYLERLKVKEAWKHTTGKGVWVADVESGFDTSHPDLRNQFDMEKTHDYDPDTDDPDKVNDNKRTHGTPVCGIIGAEADNNLFGVGIAHGAKLIGSQMANSWTTHTTEKSWTVITAKAILGSVEKGASVVLIEKQIPSTRSSVERSKVIYDAIKAAVKAGVPVVVPAGNFYEELKEEAKQEDSGSIFVGATTQEDTPALFSNHGVRLDVAAPGEQVYSVQQNSGETLTFGGTSSASAITAGITALVRSANLKLSPREIRKILKETGKPIEGTKKIGLLLQASDAVNRALDF